MLASVDGRIVTGGWPISAEERREYELVHASYEPDGWICGRITMEPFAGALRSEDEVAREHPGGPPRADFRAPGEFDSFAFAVDPSGRLAWTSNDVDGDHVGAVLSERVSDEYLAFLRDRGVSYLLAGARDVDLGLALEKIGARFGVRTLMLEGGGRINGGMLRAGLVDEVSLLVAPVADGRVGTPALLDADADFTPHRLALEAVERRAGDVLWLRYRVARSRAEDDRETRCPGRGVPVGRLTDLPERLGRLDAERAPRRHRAGEEPHRDDERGDAQDQPRPVLRQLVAQAGGDDEQRGAHRADRDPRRQLPQRAGEDGGDDAPGVRPEGGADPDLARPLRHGERHHGVDPGRRQEQRDDGEEADHRRQQPHADPLRAADVVERQHLVDVHRRVHGEGDGAQPRHERRGRAPDHPHREARGGVPAGRGGPIETGAPLRALRAPPEVAHHAHDLVRPRGRPSRLTHLAHPPADRVAPA
jgi:2,5-diamino-6-(ribosylamino)-4(3H)-pyrimidinone 5'-phosphate reductase